MNATLTIAAPRQPEATSLPSPQQAPRWLDTVLHSFRRLSRRERMLAATAIGLVALAIAGLTHGPQLMAYLTVFGLSVATNAVLFLPSGRGAVMVAAAVLLNPLAVAVITGAGGAVGELTGYAVGRGSRSMMKRASLPGWLDRYAANHMGITILLVSVIPNPFVDVIGIVAGRMGYPVGRFLAYSIVGKVAQSIVLVYLALWNIALVGGWLNLDV